MSSQTHSKIFGTGIVAGGGRAINADLGRRKDKSVGAEATESAFSSHVVSLSPRTLRRVTEQVAPQ